MASRVCFLSVRAIIQVLTVIVTRQYCHLLGCDPVQLDEAVALRDLVPDQHRVDILFSPQCARLSCVLWHLAGLVCAHFGGKYGSAEKSGRNQVGLYLILNVRRPACHDTDGCAVSSVSRRVSGPKTQFSRRDTDKTGEWFVSWQKSDARRVSLARMTCQDPGLTIRRPPGGGSRRGSGEICRGASAGR